MTSGSGHEHSVDMADSSHVDLVAVAHLTSFKSLIVGGLSWRAQSLSCVCSSLEVDFGKSICFPTSGNNCGAAVVKFCQTANSAGLLGRPVAVANAMPMHGSYFGDMCWKAFESNIMSHMPQWRVLPSTDKITDMSFLCCSVYRGREAISNTGACVFALRKASAEEAFRISVVGHPHHVVRMKTSVGILTEGTDHDLILWDGNRKTAAWTQRLLEPILMVACPDDAITLCITHSAITCFSMETGELLFRNDAVLTVARPFEEMYSYYKKSRARAVAHSDKLLFVAHAQIGTYWEPPDFEFGDDDDNGMECMALKYWFSVIDLETGDEKWTTSELTVESEIHLEYHASTGLLFVGSNSSKDMYVLHSATGHVVQHELLSENAGLINMKAVDNVIVSVVNERAWISGSDDPDMREYKVVVKSITPVGLIHFFSVTQRNFGADASQEDICDASVVHSCWINKSGRLIVMDMLTGKRVHDASLDVCSSPLWTTRWTLLFDARCFEADQGPALAPYPNASMTEDVIRQTAEAWAASCSAVVEEWVTSTVEQMGVSPSPVETLRLRCALLQQHIPTKFYEQVKRALKKHWDFAVFDI